jgi:hypothetical protein
VACARKAARYSHASLPQPDLQDLYGERYQQFLKQLTERGYLDPEVLSDSLPDVPSTG